MNPQTNNENNGNLKKEYNDPTLKNNKDQTNLINRDSNTFLGKNKPEISSNKLPFENLTKKIENKVMEKQIEKDKEINKEKENFPKNTNKNTLLIIKGIVFGKSEDKVINFIILGKELCKDQIKNSNLIDEKNYYNKKVAKIGYFCSLNEENIKVGEAIVEIQTKFQKKINLKAKISKNSEDNNFILTFMNEL